MNHRLFEAKYSRVGSQSRLMCFREIEIFSRMTLTCEMRILMRLTQSHDQVSRDLMLLLVPMWLVLDSVVARFFSSRQITEDLPGSTDRPR